MSARAPSRGWRIALALLGRLPQGLLSRAAGALADVPIPGPLRPPVLGAFARAVGIDVDEAERPLSEYPSVNAFFVRRLHPGARTFPGDPGLVASPVDGIVGAVGRVAGGRALQAKGRDYTVAALLGDPARAAAHADSHFITVYLSPRHYHRIHTPLSGRIVEARHRPGRLFPVNRPAVASVDELFAVNERLVVHLETAAGPVAVVAVGAFNVGRISAAFDPLWSGSSGGSVTNRGVAPPALRRYDPGIEVAAGDEIMAFHLGSTVVLLVPPTFSLAAGLDEGREVRAGTVLAAVPPGRDTSTANPPHPPAP